MKTKDLIKPIQLIMEGASKLITEIYDNQEDIDFQKKYDESPLTLADLRSNDFIISNLNNLYPTIPVVSEEGKEKQIKESLFWLIDPLDGTKEFIDKSEEFTINISLIEDGEPIFGAIYIPIKKSFFVGGIDFNAFSEKSGEKKELKTSFSQENCRILVSKRHQSTKEQEFFNRLKRKFKKVELFPAGSSLKFCLIASGDCHIYPRFGDVGQWDIAAGHAILKASGGNILDLTMSTIKYNSDRNMKINGFYALSNEAFYSKIIQ